MVTLVKETFSEFQRHKSPWLAAAIAYFTIFAIAPLIIVVVEIAGVVLGRHQDALDVFYGYMKSTAGASAEQVIQAIVTATLSAHKAGILAQVVGWTLFVFAAVGLFASLQEALNTIWDVTPPKRRLLETVKARLLPLGAVLAVAFLLMVFLGINAGLTIAAPAMARVFAGFATIVKILDFAISFAMIAALFALLFEYLPECRTAWRDVWYGASASAFLFVLGQFVLGWYLGRAGVASGYGSFGGLILFLIWVYYSAQIFLFGAEFTRVYARRFGSQCGSSP
jgi:membrane protein